LSNITLEFTPVNSLYVPYPYRDNNAWVENAEPKQQRWSTAWASPPPVLNDSGQQGNGNFKWKVSALDISADKGLNDG